MSEITAVGIDTAKSVFHLLGEGRGGRVCWRREVSRGRFLATLAQLPRCAVYLEACGASHYWAREIATLGHRVQLIAPYYVKPYRQGPKNDYQDAEAVLRAGRAPRARYVGIKSAGQLELQAYHRVRARLKRSRTATANQLRGLLAEHGHVFAQGIGKLREGVVAVLERLPERLQVLAGDLLAELATLDDRLGWLDRELQRWSREVPVVKDLVGLPGVGPTTGTALVAHVGDPQAYRNGRQYSGCLGVVPGQHSTGGKARLGRISKRGDAYVRTLLIHGARSAIRALGDKQDPESRWLRALVERRGVNCAAVALANKNARRAWAIMARHGGMAA